MEPSGTVGLRDQQPPRAVLRGSTGTPTPTETPRVYSQIPSLPEPGAVLGFRCDDALLLLMTGNPTPEEQS